ncbi:MAG: outer membrane beta-barrel protein [Bryobacteraceae bacterium]|nr:outer membrane beta-barrel protein [Bryobacteraceae bacterium]
MSRNIFRFAIPSACAALCLAALSLPALGEALSGGIDGLARDAASGQPVPQARITAHNVAQDADVTAISGADGTFSIPKLEPGLYLVAATRDGFSPASKKVDVATSGRSQVDFLLAANRSGAPESTAAASGQAISDELEALRRRIEQLEASLKARPAEVQPAAAAPSQEPAPAPSIPEALQSPDPSPSPDNDTPFAFGDFTWLNGTSRNKDAVLDTKFFTPEVRFDTHFMTDFNQPKDHTMGGATESFRSGEFQVEQISVGGDFHWQNVRGRILTMDGLFATTTPRNDGSAGVGQWDARGAYKYVSEAYGGYHFNVNHGLNVDAGIFVSYIGLFSYYNFDNWTYQPSFVSSNTPWFFNGLRIQWFPTNKLKIEPWIVNGWQSYNKVNGHRGLGGQILYRPYEWLSMVFNNYGNGTDTLGVPGRSRLHTDDSVEVRYLNNPGNTGISKAAFSFTVDAGCEYGGGVTCHGGKAGPKQAFLGWMLYNRIWFHKDLLGLTLGGGMMNNPGRYLTLLPPINGADAISGSPYFTANPGDKAHMWDSTVTLQYMPKQYITWWAEAGYRHSDVPYWSGRGGITPPGGNNGSPSQYVCNTGASAGTNDLTAAYAACGGAGSVWFPDLRKGQATLSVGVMVKF